MSNTHLLWKRVSSETEASFSSSHLVSRLGKTIKWNGSKIFLNNLIGWTNTEVSSEWYTTVLHVTKITHAEASISWTSTSDAVAYWRSFFSVRSTIVSYRRRGQSSSALQRHMTSEYILMCVYTYREYIHRRLFLKNKEKPSVQMLDWTFPFSLSKSKQFLCLMM